MRRSPLVAVVVTLVLLVTAAACGDDSGDDASSSTTGVEPVATDGAEELAVCAPLSALVGIFVDLQDLATGSPEGAAAADATLTSALDQIDDLEPDPSPEVADAVATLRDVSFADAEEPSAAASADADAAVTTLTDQLGEPCGPLGG